MAKTQVGGKQITDSSVTHDDINLSGASTKSTPINADSIPLIDSADSNKIKRVLISVWKALFEPHLGNPASNGQVLSSTTGGTRSWITPSAGSSSYCQANLANSASDIGYSVKASNTEYQLNLYDSTKKTSGYIFGTNQITVTNAGEYQIDVTAPFTGTSTGNISFSVKVNGTTVFTGFQRNASAGNPSHVSASHIITLSANDVITLWFSSGSSMTTFTIYGTYVSSTLMLRKL